jgi:hypothetical protein
MFIFHASSNESSEARDDSISSNKSFTAELPSDDQLNDLLSRGVDPYLSFIEEARQRTEERLKSEPNAYCELHHITPRFEGGTDDPSNLVYLSYNDHVIAHYIRFFVYKKPQDWTAFKVMSGQTEDIRREISALAGKIGGPLAQKQHKERQTGWFDPKGQSERGKKGAATNREQGTGAYDPENLKRANEVLKQDPEKYRPQQLANLEKGRQTQREKGIGIGDPIKQRLKSLMRFDFIELDGKKYSLNTEHRTYICETTLDYYLRYAPRRS